MKGKGSANPNPLINALQPSLTGTDTKTQPTAQKFCFIDLFAGIGGLRRGFEAMGGKCVFSSEWNVHAQKTYRANYGDDEIAGDITAIEAKHIPRHDILLAGFPCQPFSIAGRKLGFACTAQGTLFILKRNPAYIHYEKSLI